MRVKTKTQILLCTTVTHNPYSKLVFLSTPNGVYTVNMLTNENAEKLIDDLLKLGYYDISEYEYTN